MEEVKKNFSTIYAIGGFYCAHQVGALPEKITGEQVFGWVTDHLSGPVNVTSLQVTAFLPWANHPRVRAWREEGRKIYDELRAEGVIPDAGSPWDS